MIELMPLDRLRFFISLMSFRFYYYGPEVGLSNRNDVSNLVAS
jgi:hypothetical protein